MSHSVRESIDWAVRAWALAEALPVARLHPRVVARMRESMTADRWHVAMSGGADSLALLLLVWAHWPERRAAMVALHFNHKLRGAESDADEAFCREVCGALGVKIETGAADWPDGPESVSEAQAREARLGFFKRAMSSASEPLLFLGHQKNDVAETMLMRLARGSGAAGLAAPRPVAHHGAATHLRPLLGLSHAEIVDALRAAGLEWREDATNEGNRFFRTRVRASVIPAIEAASPSGFLEAAAASRELLEEDDDALELWADRLVPERRANPLPAAPLRDCPRAVARRVLQRWLLAQGGEGALGRAAFDELLGAVLGGAAFRRSAGEGAFVAGDGASVFWESAGATGDPWEPFQLAVPGRATMPDGAVLECTIETLDDEGLQALFSGENSGPFRVYLGFEEALPAWFAVRNWRPGDRFAPLGGKHESKLQDHFTNRRIPRGIRHRLPVVTDSLGRVLWVPGLPPAECVRVQPGATRAVCLTYLPPETLSEPRHG
ncbi:MAG TPA: tRNA lysidine(34) synthetase TilS [Opitutaceae bacterium]